MQKILISIALVGVFNTVKAQDAQHIILKVTDEKQEDIITDILWIKNQDTLFVSTDENGLAMLSISQEHLNKIIVNNDEYETYHHLFTGKDYVSDTFFITLRKATIQYNEVVITGNLRPTMRAQSPVNIEVYNHTFFKSNPQPTLFESLETINGIRPQNNCNVCNTGDIHINGLEGPYTMVLIDGMPIVSGLSTVYGLSGIPTSLIERIEVMKGPASTLYGSEAIGGLINVITKTVDNAPYLSADMMGTSWSEWNMDLATKFNLGKNIQSIIGVNGYIYDNPVDKNGDNFTDVTLQKRISAFNKWQFKRKNNKELSTAFRYISEDRWGGEMQWTKADKGSNDIYGETITTKRFEAMGKYQLPVLENSFLTASYNRHFQDSYYGNMHFKAQQNIFFTQLTKYLTYKHHDILIGATYRYTYYDDNTVATADKERKNTPQQIHLPGLFIQDEWMLTPKSTLLMGIRYDYNNVHGSIVTPRLNYKWQSEDLKNTLRMSVGNGYRVAYIFTEDHAALTGARDVILKNDLKPETSWNTDLRYEKKLMTTNDQYISIDFGGFFTYFNNRIMPDYDSHPNQIIYDNLNGYGISRGISMNIDAILYNNTRITSGWTYMDVFTKDRNVKTRPYFTEKFTATWTINYKPQSLPISFDYTGNLYSPMLLPLLSEWDPRPGQSPWYSIQNIQITYPFAKNFELYGGIKNILNWTPNKSAGFLIARPYDPFDKEVDFDHSGVPMVTPQNPYGLSFDPGYVYASNQGRRFFLGLRYKL